MAVNKNPCSFADCKQKADPKLFEIKTVSLPPDPKEFYDNELK